MDLVVLLWSKMIGQQKSPSHVADEHVKGKVWTPTKLDDRKRQPVDVPRNRRPNTCSARGGGTVLLVRL